MNPENYTAFTFVGLGLIILVISFDITAYSKVLAGVLLGIGLSISAFSFYKRLVNDESGKTKR